MYVLRKKLHLLKNRVKFWNKETFGNIHDLVNLSLAKLDSIQERISFEGPSAALRIQEKRAMQHLEKD